MKFSPYVDRADGCFTARLIGFSSPIAMHLHRGTPSYNLGRVFVRPMCNPKSEEVINCLVSLGPARSPWPAKLVGFTRISGLLVRIHFVRPRVRAESHDDERERQRPWR